MLVPQVLDALFGCLRQHEDFWLKRETTEPVPVYGDPVAPPPPPSLPDPAEGAQLFGDGLAALEPILARALRPAILEALRAAAQSSSEAPVLPDQLWASTVAELAAAHRQAVISQDHLVRAAVPLYLGRVAAFAAANDGDPAAVVERRLEDLCLQFERSRGELIGLWGATAR